MIDLVGKKFGKKLVLSKEGTKKIGKGQSYSLWKVLCDCGNEYITSTPNLHNAKKKNTCGCNRKFKNLINKEFGYGIVIKYLGRILKSTKRKVFIHNWQLKCKCGNVYESNSDTLLAGKKKSCGCSKFCPILPNWNNNYTKSSFKTIFSRLKGGAKKRNLQFNITIDDVYKLYDKQNGKCSMTGIDISFENLNVSVDRIDSSLGYTLNNIQLVYRPINFMKQNLPNSMFIELCTKVADYHHPQNGCSR